jgi:ADP-heptose:LPS heptosyltransferase
VRWTERGFEVLLECGLQRRSLGSTPAFTKENVRRILVVRKDNIGDLICTTPALRALRQAFPAAHVAILVSKHCRSVVERNADLDEVLTYPKAKYHRGIPRLWAMWELGRVIRRLRRRHFDLAIAMGRPCSRSSAWLAYASGAPWRLGYATPALRPFPFFLNLECDPGAITSHEVDACLELLASIGIPSAGRRLTLIPDPEAQATIRERLAEAGIAPGERVALIHISSRREANRWPLASFAQVADLLRERFDLTIALSWAPGDAGNSLFPGDDGKAEEVARHMRATGVLLRTPTLDELIAAMSLSAFVLSADGGPVHVAAALDIPQVALFGKAGIAAWAPVSEKSVVLKRGARVDLIGVDEVLEAASAVLSRWGREAPNRVRAGALSLRSTGA